jgi:type IV fimbrial biogenesis protein FimT
MKAKSSGFTLLEIMMVVALLAVLIGLAAPSFGDFVRNSRITGKANDLLGGLNLARTEAIKRHVPISVCAVADASLDTPVCKDTADFSQWIAFVDDDTTTITAKGTDGNGVFNSGSGEILLTRSSGTVASIKTIPSSDVKGYIQFGLDGFQRRSGGAAPTDLSIRMCDDRKNKAISGANISAARALFISRTGRSEVSRSVSRITTAGGCP